MGTPRKPEHALILNGSNAEGALDRKMLFRIGIRSAQTADSIASAFKLLEKARTGQNEPIDIIICGTTLADGDAEFFIKKLHKNRSTYPLPAVIITTEPTRELILRTLHVGWSSFISRPYTLDTLAQQTVHAVLNTYGLKEATEAQPSSSPLPEQAPETPEVLCEHGNRLLKNHYWDSAFETFTKAISLEPTHAEAFVGRAKAWRGKGDHGRYTKELNHASQLFMQQHDYKNASNALRPIFGPEDMQNPLFNTAKSLLQKGDFCHAASAYVHGEPLTPALPLHQQISRACAFTCSPQKAAAVLCKKVSEMGYQDKAKQLYKRIVDSPARRHRPKQTKKTWMEVAFPALYEVVSVAKYSYRTYQKEQQKQAA
ncbi:MAG: hypothetical protein MI749_13620 [Desulfovibrionales bacterium]|nr:hypothetical protein [Desulfovibrionales bacterium]